MSLPKSSANDYKERLPSEIKASHQTKITLDVDVDVGAPTMSTADYSMGSASVPPQEAGRRRRKQAN